MKDKITRVLSAWGLQEEPVSQIYGTAWQVGENYILKRYEDRNLLEKNLKIVRMLAEKGVPVAGTVPTRDGRDYVPEEDSFCFLSERLPGSNLVRLDTAMGIARKMGGIMADLHIAFQACEREEAFPDSSLLDEMNGWVKESFEKKRWSCLEKEEYEKLVARLATVYDRLPVQLIHRDIHFGNFLFADGVFSGYIDFDLSQRNIRIFDLCYFLSGLLSEKETKEITREQWLAFVKDTVAGYEEKLPLSEAEKQAIPWVMACVELFCAAWFENNGNRTLSENACRISALLREWEEDIRESIRQAGVE